jgi:hypothetical protein
VAAARTSAAAAIVVVTVVVTAAVADAGAAVADAIAVDALRARAWAAATCLPPSTLRRKAASRAAMNRVATITAAAISEARKIAVASRAVSNPGDPRSAASTIALRKLRARAAHPLPSMLQKNPSFYPASLSPSTEASPWPRPFRQLSSRNLTSRNVKSKKQFLAHLLT